MAAVTVWRSRLPRGRELERLALAEAYPGRPPVLVELDAAVEATRLVRAAEWSAADLLFTRRLMYPAATSWAGRAAPPPGDFRPAVGGERAKGDRVRPPLDHDRAAPRTPPAPGLSGGATVAVTWLGHEDRWQR